MRHENPYRGVCVKILEEEILNTKYTTLAPHCVWCSAGEVTKGKRAKNRQSPYLVYSLAPPARAGVVTFVFNGFPKN
jgi:hypothetical protein